MQIKQHNITPDDNFPWGDEWRALSISKENREGTDHYFAQIVRFYGKKYKTHQYDIGSKREDFAWIGRSEKIVGEYYFDVDPHSPTKGQRLMKEPEYMEGEYRDANGNTIKTKYPVSGKILYVYSHPVNKENTEKFKSLIGPLNVSMSTAFDVISGSEPPVSVPESVFFSKSVEEIMAIHHKVADFHRDEKDDTKAAFK